MELDVSRSAIQLSRSPLGIIALFIVMVYGLACLVLTYSHDLDAVDRRILIIFVVAFPVIVLGSFVWLVAVHPSKLYAPGDFKDEANFVRAVGALAVAATQTTIASDDVKPSPPIDVNSIVRQVAAARTTIEGRPTNTRTVLWVDDHPEGNTNLRLAFEALGLTVILALSTNEALQLLRANSYGTVISDMARREGMKEGLVLLDEIRTQGIQTPFFVYTRSARLVHRQEAIRHGAQGLTADPNELFEWVTGSQHILQGRQSGGN